MRKKHVLRTVSLFCTAAVGFSFSAPASASAAETASDAFDSLANDLYWGILELMPSNLHFYQSSTDNLPFDLTNPLGAFTEEAVEEQALIDQFNERLSAISFNSLDSHQKKVYRSIRWFLDCEAQSLALPDYASTLGPMGGLLTSTNTVMTEYYLRNDEDIQNYIAMLNDIPRFLNDILLEIDYQETLGIAPSAYAYSEALSKKDGLTSIEEHPYLNAFISNIAEAGLSDESVSSYVSQVSSILTDTIIPAYQNFFAALETKSQTAGESRGLCSYDQGLNYYEALIRANTGSDMSADAMFDYLESKIADDIIAMSEIYYRNPSAVKAADAIEVPTTDPEEILSLLEEKTLELFPEIDNHDFQLSYLPKTLEQSNTLAYYMSPPSDLLSRNVIRVNGSAIGSDEAMLWTTLSHEGFPGHLYQTQYTRQYVSAYPLEALLSCTGTSEGWAFYVERMSLDWADVDEDTADIYWYNSSINMALSALVDIGVNAKDWTNEDIASFLSDYLSGITADSCQSLYDTVANDPGAYLPYAFGYYQMVDLFDSINTDYSSESSMYRAFLNVSTLPLSLVNKYLITDGSI